MPVERERLAGALVLLMLLAPIAAAATTSWVGPSTVNPQGESVTLTGFRVPRNATVLDGWLHVTDSPMAASLDDGITWEGTDFSSGTFFDTELVDDGILGLVPSHVDSAISTFDEGSFTVELNSFYNFSPGWRHVYDYSYSSTGLSGCGGDNGTALERGWDNDFNQSLDDDEVLWTDYFCDTVVNGTTIHWRFEFFPESAGANCEYGGNLMNAGLNLDGDNQLDANEISNQTYLCHQFKLWGATTFRTLNGTMFGNQQNLSHGVVPAAASEGVVAVGTMPGSPVPAGTAGYFLMPQVDVPAADINNYYLTFDHWYHLDSTAAGGGDGAWVEYRINTNGWTDWSYIAPDGGYPSTMSTSAPSPGGAPSGAVPVFASSTHSGWVTSNISMSSIPDISNASKVQFRFHIWTDPTSTNERPGWFLDNISYHNDGVEYGAWHGGCYTPGSTCTYSANQYGALQTTLNLTGTNSTHEIEVDMEWDLAGSYSDNACVELSLNNNTWTDISSSGSSTTYNCEDRAGAIPGVSGYDGVSGDQSNGIRTVSFDIPTSFQNQANVHIRFIVDSDAYIPQYGGNYADDLEGLTVDNIRIVDGSGNVLFEDDLETTTSMYHYGAVWPNPSSNTQAGVDDWDHYFFVYGDQNITEGFENSIASDPASSMPSGWTRSPSTGGVASKWSYGQITSTVGPTNSEPSFPYAMAINLGGVYGGNLNANLTSPTYTLPANSRSTLVFDHWACFENNWDGGGIFIQVNNGSWNYWDPGNNFYDTPSIAYTYTAIPQGSNYFGSVKCTGSGSAYQVTDLTWDHKEGSLVSYAGNDVRFRFHGGSDGIWNYAGWYLDNVGITISNYTAPGDWLSPDFNASGIHDFNLGFIDIDASIPSDTWIRASLIDTDTGQAVPGYSNVSFPISLAGVDTTTTPQMKLRIHMGTNDQMQTPEITKIHIGGKRVLNAAALEGNGWELSPNVSLIDGLLNATGVAGSVSMDYLHSSRPIKSVWLSGDYSSNLSINFTGPNGGVLGTASQGGLTFAYPQPGFGVSISLPTNGSIGKLVLTANFAEPALNPDIDVLGDGTHEWSFPFGDDYGHYGWQSLLSGMGSSVTATTLNLDGTNPSSLAVRIPWAFGTLSTTVNAGIIAVSPDNNGFESPVTVSLGLDSQSSSSANTPFYNVLDNAQIFGINQVWGSHTDPTTGREWREFAFNIDSSSAQTVTVTRIGIGYTIFENASVTTSQVSAYIDSQTQNEPEVPIPVNISAEMGSVSVGGGIVFTFDADGDGFDNEVEIACGSDPEDTASVPLDTDADGICDPIDADDDADGWTDTDEAACGTQSLNASSVPVDTDGDLSCDVVDTDDDNDNLPDVDDDCPAGDIGWTSDSTTDHDLDGCQDSDEDSDDDNDSIADTYDSCPTGALWWVSSAATDYDTDGCQDWGEDYDDDNDGVADYSDSCPTGELGWTSDSTTDNDGDGCKDSSTEDLDDDNDGTLDTDDDFPLDASADTDTDGDGMPDDLDGASSTGLVADWDDDNDGLSDNAENSLGTNPTNADTDGDSYTDFDDEFPLDSTEWSDFDGDGIGDNADQDDDNDNWTDNYEIACMSDPLYNSSVPLDTDGDGDCDELDGDDDGDGVEDEEDDFPLDAGEWDDTDGDGTGDNADLDDDGDWVPDFNDAFPLDPNEWDDTDGDGVGDNSDAFPNDPTQNSDEDADGYGDNPFGNFPDGCPDEFGTSVIDFYGCVDSDGDGVSYINDQFPNDPELWGDTDDDGPGFGLILALAVLALVALARRN